MSTPPAIATHNLIEGTVTCGECQAINPAGVHFCAECGATVDFVAPKKSEAAARLRHEAGADLKRAHRWIGWVAIAYRFGAGAYALATLLALLALARPDVPVTEGYLVVALTTTLSVTLLMAALHLLFEPFLWTFVIALFATGVSIVHTQGPDPFGIGSIGSAAWALLAWGALVPTFRFRRWVAHHKDLYILHHASSQTRRALRGRSAHERHERLLGAMRRAARRTWKLSTAIGAVIVFGSSLGSYVVVSTMRPHDLGDSLATFESSWNSGDLAAVEALFAIELRDSSSRTLHGRVRGFGWDGSLPHLGGGTTSQEDESAQVEYDVAGVPLTSSWIRRGNAWTLTSLDLPYPAPDPQLAQFEEAWNDSDADAIAQLFKESARAEMKESIVAAAEGREWPSFPSIRETKAGDPSGGEVSVVFLLEEGKVNTQWHFRSEGGWLMHGLRFPKR